MAWKMTKAQMAKEAAEKEARKQERAALRERMQATVAGEVARVAAMTDAAAQQEAVLAYIAVQARFHQYSWNNVMMILSQRPDATRVAGYRAWQGFGRQVRKGEKGIAIFGFSRWFEKDAAGERVEGGKSGVYFPVVYVFDVAQTDGEALPEADALVIEEGDEGGEVYAKLTDAAASFGVKVAEEEMRKSQGGYAEQGKIGINRDRHMAAKAATMAHEIAHQILHIEGGRLFSSDRALREIEAEAASAVVMSFYGLPVDKAANYIALWGGDGKAVLARLDAIKMAARKIIEAAEKMADEEGEALAA